MQENTVEHLYFRTYDGVCYMKHLFHLRLSLRNVAANTAFLVFEAHSKKLPIVMGYDHQGWELLSCSHGQ